MRKVLILAATSTIVACGARSNLADLLGRDTASSGASTGSGASGTSSSGGGVPASDCPAPEMPSLASECVAPGQVCAYHRAKMGPCSDTSLADIVAWRCEDGRWLEIARCVDP